MDDILDEITGLVSFFLVTESDESLDDVSNESYDDDEDKKSEKNSIYFCSVWTRSWYLIASL